jgi:hypothetical protein
VGDQKELPGVRPAHMKRLEEIEDAISKNKEKISALKDANADLEAEAIGIWDKHELTEPHLRGEDEWEVVAPARKFRPKRHKITKEKSEKKQKKASA